jgi:hypothetical protein
VTCRCQQDQHTHTHTHTHTLQEIGCDLYWLDSIQSRVSQIALRWCVRCTKPYRLHWIQFQKYTGLLKPGLRVVRRCPSGDRVATVRRPRGDWSATARPPVATAREKCLQRPCSGRVEIVRRLCGAATVECSKDDSSFLKNHVGLQSCDDRMGAISFVHLVVQLNVASGS